LKILNATCDANVCGTAFARGSRHVCSDYIAGAFCSAAPGLLHTVADATFITRPWRGEPLAGKRLLIYRPLGIGDEFLTARLAYVAGERYHAAQVGLAIFAPHHEYWQHTPGLPFRLFSPIVPFADWQSADFHVAGEHWWEEIATADQPDVWAIMEAATNTQIPPEMRRPYIPAVSSEMLAKAADMLASVGPDAPIVLWQVAATSRIRSYPPHETLAAISLIRQQTNAHVIAIGHPAQFADYLLADRPGCSVYSAGIPGVLALVAAAAARGRACVVCPDSVIGHVAAAHPSLPVVSLWSSFHPRTRVATYPNHRPIYNAIRCSPCWSHERSGDPAKYQGCPHTLCNDYCAGLRSIPPAQIAAAVVAAFEGTPPSSP
jgi:ADP-heptose:LPS heptosyltransferase